MSNAHTLWEPEDEIQAGDIEAMLREEGIVASMLREQDTAYPGIADARARWGAILVAEEDLERAQELLADFLEAEVEPPVLGPYRTEAHEDKGVGAYESLHARTRRGARALLLLFVALPLLLLSLSLLLRLILRR